jgi:hypothetical protein
MVTEEYMKRIISILLVTVLLLVGCKQEDALVPQKQSNIKEDTSYNITKEPEEVDSKPLISEEGGNLKQLNLKNSNAQACSNSEGYYYLSQRSVNPEDSNTILNLMYLDYATKKEVFLCSNPSCQHNSEECTSFIPTNTMCEYSIFLNQDRLYLVEGPFDQGGGMLTGFVNPEAGAMISTGTDEVPCTIYQMNLDGTGKTKLCEFSSGEIVENSFLGDNDSLYIISKKIKEEQLENDSMFFGVTDRKLMKLDLNTLFISDISTLSSEERVIGCFGNQIVLKETKYQTELTPEEKYDDAVFYEAFSKSEELISTLAVDTGERKDLLRISNAKDISYACEDENLFYSVKGEGQIHCFNLKTGQSKDILQQEYGRIQDVYNQVLICADWDFNNNKYCSLDTKTQELSKINLFTKAMNSPVVILADTETMFLVEYDYEVHKEEVAWAGTTQDVITKHKLGLISKKDYYQGEANYQEVELEGYGR